MVSIINCVQYELVFFSRGYHRSMISIINYVFQQCEPEPEHWWLIPWHYIQLFWQFIYLFRCILYLYSVKNSNPYSSPSQPCYYYYYWCCCCCCYNSWVVVVDKNKCGQDSFLCNKLILLIQQKLTHEAYMLNSGTRVRVVRVIEDRKSISTQLSTCNITLYCSE